MNKKLLSIACLALTLCGVSTPSAADVTSATTAITTENGIKIFGHTLEAVHASKHRTTITPKKLEKVQSIIVSSAGLVHKAGLIKISDSASDFVLFRLNRVPPVECRGEVRIESGMGINCGGPLIALQGNLEFSAPEYNFEHAAVFGTNGTITLNFTAPTSLIKSITLQPSILETSYKNNKIHIGSIFGKFTGVPSEQPQSLNFIGYPSITIEFNPEAIAELLSKK